MLPNKTVRIAQRKSDRVLFQRLQRLARRTADSAVHIHRTQNSRVGSAHVRKPESAPRVATPMTWLERQTFSIRDPKLLRKTNGTYPMITLSTPFTAV